MEIFEQERDAYDSGQSIQPILLAVSPVNKELTLRNLIERAFADEAVIQAENAWRSNEQSVLQTWDTQIENFETANNSPNAKDAERYIEEAGLQTIIRQDIEWTKRKIEAQELIDIHRFPSVIAMLYSQYYRIHDRNRKSAPGDVTDISIIGASPYVDVILTENFQAEIFKKIKPRIERMANLEIGTMRDIRK